MRWGQAPAKGGGIDLRLFWCRPFGRAVAGSTCKTNRCYNNFYDEWPFLLPCEKKNSEASVHSAQQQLALWHNSQNSSTPWHGEWLCYVAFVNQLKSSISYKKMCLDNILLLWGAPDCCHERILTIHIQHIYKLQTYNFQWPLIVHKKHCLVPVAVKCKRKRLWCKLKSTATFCSRATQSKLRSSARRKVLLSARRTQAWAEEPLPSRQKGRKWSNSFWQIAKSHWRTMSMYWLASSPLILVV